MKHLDEYRDPAFARTLAMEITRRACHAWTLMEICGGQTHTLMRYGLPDLLPSRVQLVHGPGCPVCVTPLEMVDKAIALAAMPEVTLLTYGDMMRVPGSRSDLFAARARGGNVQVVYSPLDALKRAECAPHRKIVFFGIGFETTAPAHALAVLRAVQMNLVNFFLLSSHVLVPPAMRLLLSSPRNRVQGLIAPGHVCTVMGYRQYEELCREYEIPIVVGGFEPADLLEAILMLVTQLEEGRVEVENQYKRSVSRSGNLEAQQAMECVFEVCDRKWRGLGNIPQSGLRLRREFAAFDAEQAFALQGREAEESAACISAEVLQGRKRPPECPEFGSHCTPDHPLGAPMVSAEGACAAYYRYRRVPAAL
jgi:hydrogenase expression/formation protein HypD